MLTDSKIRAAKDITILHLVSPPHERSYQQSPPNGVERGLRINKCAPQLAIQNGSENYRQLIVLAVEDCPVN
ncbi:hypothetical protein DDT56_14180 [Brenneria corticis]|uniref:Uncharacterized protein n=1 Tax=Brenneria corticis TaxID=2173106 RepID=A0A2U1TXA2_9GAMM|nr:hypothetical protein DDT56_14180 [Brenneria sp. CFCC 11842]